MDMKKTQKHDVLPPEDQNSWSNALEEHPLIHWLTDNGKVLLYILAGLILFLILIFRFALSKDVASEADFIHAEKEYRLFSAPVKEGEDLTLQTSALKNLNKILTAHPELHPKYDGPIAEILLIRGESALAMDYAKPAIDRTKSENEPFYTGYAQTTLKIANGNYGQALKDAMAMKEQMIKEGEELKETPEKLPFSTLLYSLNLLRIGMLQQQLALRTDELKTWQEWKDLLKKSREGSLPAYLNGPLFMSFDNLLSEGNTSFTDYIEAREKNS